MSPGRYCICLSRVFTSAVGVAPGGYVLRIGRDVDASARLVPGRLPAASFRLGPML